MNGHLIPRTPEEEAALQAPFRADLAAWPDMAQMDEPEPRRIDWLNVAAWGAAFALCLAFWAMVAWGILRRVF